MRRSPWLWSKQINDLLTYEWREHGKFQKLTLFLTEFTNDNNFERFEAKTWFATILASSVHEYMISFDHNAPISSVVPPFCPLFTSQRRRCEATFAKLSRNTNSNGSYLTAEGSLNGGSRSAENESADEDVTGDEGLELYRKWLVPCQALWGWWLIWFCWNMTRQGESWAENETIELILLENCSFLEPRLWPWTLWSRPSSFEIRGCQRIYGILERCDMVDWFKTG